MCGPANSEQGLSNWHSHCMGYMYSSDVRHGYIVSEVGRFHGRDCKSVAAYSLVQFYQPFPRNLLPPSGEWIL